MTNPTSVARFTQLGRAVDTAGAALAVAKAALDAEMARLREECGAPPGSALSYVPEQGWFWSTPNGQLLAPPKQKDATRGAK